jgi:hypothetical protein
MSEYTLRDLAGNPAVEAMETDPDGCGGTGLPDDPAAEMAAAFRWDHEESPEEVDAHYAAWFRGEVDRYDGQARTLTDDQLIAAVELADHPNDPMDLGAARVPYTYAMTAEVLRRAGEDPDGRSLERDLSDSVALEEATRTLPPEHRRTVRRIAEGGR